MNATELKKDIKDIEGAIASPVTPDFIKEKMKSKLVELKQQLKELETPAPAKKPTPVASTKKPTPDKKEKSDKIKLKEIKQNYDLYLQNAFGYYLEKLIL